jgi:hypothetical protein
MIFKYFGVKQGCGVCWGKNIGGGGGLLGAKYVCLVLKVRDYNLVKLCEWIVLKITFPSLTRGFNTTNLLNGKIYTTPISLSLIFYFVEVKEKIFTLR